MRIIKKLKQRKLFWWSLIACLGAWGYTECQFRVDPLSYFLYPIRRTASFPLYPDSFFLAERAPRSLAFSPDGQSIFTSRKEYNEITGPETVMSWDISTGQSDLIYEPDNYPRVDRFAVSEDQNWLAVPGALSAVQIRDGQTGKVQTVLEGKQVAIRNHILSPDGSIAVGAESKSGSDRASVKLWNTSTGTLLQELDSYSGNPHIAFSPSGGSLSIAQSSFLDVWNVADRTKQYTTQIADGISALNFGTDELITLQSDRCAIQQIDATTGQSIRKLGSRQKTYSSGYPASTVSPNGKTLVCYLSTQNTSSHDEDPERGIDLELIDITTGDRTDYIEDVKYIEHFEFSPDGQSFARANRRGSITIHRLKEGREVGTIEIDNYGREFTYQPDGKAILGINREGSALLFDASTGKTIRQIVKPNAPFAENIGASPSLSRDGKTLTTVSYSALSIWDNRGKEPKLARTVPIFHPLRDARNMTLSPSGQRFALTGHDFYAKNVRFVGYDYDYESTLILGDVETGEITHIVKGDAKINDVVFSADGKLIAMIYRDRTAQVWDAATAVPIHSFKISSKTNFWTQERHRSEIGRIALSEDSKRLVTSDEHAIHLWDLDSGEWVRTLMTDAGIGPTEWLKLDGDIAISPDGKWIAASRPPTFPTIRYDNKIYLWNAETGRLVRAFIPHSLDPRSAGKIRSLTFSPDSTSLAAGNDLNRLTVWTLPQRLSL